MTLSTPVKVVALAGLVCILALGGLLALAAARRANQTVSTTPAVQPPVPARHPAPAQPRLVIAAGLPTAVHRALETSREAVVLLTASGVAADADTAAAALSGAHAAGVAFVRLDVAREADAEQAARWLPGVADPAVLVVRRPGRVVSTLHGFADETMVAQLAADAR